MKSDRKSNTILFGTGEYVTGYTPGGQSKSDKAIGVVGIVHFDLRERGLIGDKIAQCGTNGDKFDDIREHFDKNINQVFTGLNTNFVQYPEKGIF